MSASSMPTVYPRARSARARFVETVDLPTPPFPDATAILYLTPERICPGGGPPCGPAADRDATSTVIRTLLTPGTFFTVTSASRPICSAAFWFSVWKRTVNETLPPSTLTSWTNPNDTMSRESPGNLTPLSASRICSEVGIRFLLDVAFVRRADDRDRLFVRGHHRYRAHILRTGQPARDHRLVDPVDQTVPHCTDQDQRMLGDVLDLDELPHHEQLQRRPDAARQHDER